MNSARPPLAVFAYSEVGYACLDELIRQGANVAVVFTHDDDPRENIWFRSVKELALANSIPVRTDEKTDESAAALLKELGVEIIFSFYYRAMIPKDVLGAARLGAYNMHGALLPKYRGRACINWAVINGEKETGATLHVMTELADRGDIVDQGKVPVLQSDTALDVFMKVAGAARRILARSLAQIEAGNPRLTPQDESQATKFGRRTPEDGLIDWSKSAEEIYNLVRALTRPFPGAFTVTDGKKLFIWRAKAIRGSAPAGEKISHEPLIFGTGSGLLEVLSYQFAEEPERSF